MTLLSCVKIGAGAGFATGLVSASYFGGMTDRLDRESSVSAYGTAIIAGGSMLLGAPAGAAIGAGFYAANKSIKYLRAAPLPVRVLVGGVVSTSIAAKLSYELGASK